MSSLMVLDIYVAFDQSYLNNNIILKSGYNRGLIHDYKDVTWTILNQ